jgi:hypothetical protein
MRTRSKLLLAGMSVALFFAFAVSTAAARELSINETDFEVRWNDLDFIAGNDTTECDVTLLGEFHENIIEKIVGSLIGNIFHASVGPCVGGAGATVLTADLPWHVRYRGISGTLPGITGIGLGLIGAAFRVDPIDLPACLARTDATEPGVGQALRNTTTGQVTVLNADESASIDLEDEEFLCAIAGDAEFNGDGVVTDLDGDLLFVTLV